MGNIARFALSLADFIICEIDLKFYEMGQDHFFNSIFFTYLNPWLTSMMELFANIVNGV